MLRWVFLIIGVIAILGWLWVLSLLFSPKQPGGSQNDPKGISSEVLAWIVFLPAFVVFFGWPVLALTVAGCLAAFCCLLRFKDGHAAIQFTLSRLLLCTFLLALVLGWTIHSNSQAFRDSWSFLGL
jgi:hypothetical protein